MWLLLSHNERFVLGSNVRHSSDRADDSRCMRWTRSSDHTAAANWSCSHTPREHHPFDLPLPDLFGIYVAMMHYGIPDAFCKPFDVSYTKLNQENATETARGFRYLQVGFWDFGSPHLSANVLPLSSPPCLGASPGWRYSIATWKPYDSCHICSCMQLLTFR